MSVVMTHALDAVCVKNAFKNYGENQAVLQDFCVTVKQGIIYGLLGASGCGKTTLLSCIIGQRKLTSGSILVFGQKPGRKGTGIPGKNLGYMPQELALYKEYTIYEMFSFFGSLFGMKKSSIRKKTEFLINLLDLEFISKKPIRQFSGGERRRVSFGVALLHEAPLLLLDEPTVGLDAALRDRIWQHLLQIVRDEHRTVIMSTHYIEEARQAHAVGLMRDGKLLADGNPEFLLEKHTSVSLENLFRKLCNTQDISVTTENGLKRASTKEGFSEKRMRKLKKQFSVEHTMETEKAIKILSDSVYNRHLSNSASTFFHMTTLIKKSTKRMFKSGLLIMIAIVPVLTLFWVYLASSNLWLNFPIAVVNHEYSNEPICVPHTACIFSNLSCRYLYALEKRGLILQPYYDDQEAITAIRKGEVYAALSFPSNFSEHFLNKAIGGISAATDTLLNSIINVNMDYSNAYIGNAIKVSLVFGFLDFTTNIATSCDLDPKSADVPLVFGEPIYGFHESPISHFFLSGISLLVGLSSAMVLTLYTFLDESKGGVLGRVLSSGVQLWEVLGAQFVLQTVLMIFQCCSVLFFIFFVFKLPLLGSALLVLCLFISMGFLGLVIGMIVSLLAQDERVALQILYVFIFPMILVSGCFYPIETAPMYMQLLSKFVPNTLPTKALRSIIFRGFGIEHEEVRIGLIIIWGWIAVLGIVLCFLIRYKNFKM